MFFGSKRLRAETRIQPDLTETDRLKTTLLPSGDSSWTYVPVRYLWTSADLPLARLPTMPWERRVGQCRIKGGFFPFSDVKGLNLTHHFQFRYRSTQRPLLTVHECIWRRQRGKITCQSTGVDTWCLQEQLVNNRAHKFIQ